MAKNKSPLTSDQLRKIINEHLIFLESGGAGGRWTNLVINGIVLGIYDSPGQPKGEQARLEHIQLNSECSLESHLLSFANCCGLYAPGLNAGQADMSYSLLTDTFLPKAKFQDAFLKRTDFSRSVLAKVDFRGADLRYADFENCDLCGADFRGARLEGARFPGAILEEVLL